MNMIETAAALALAGIVGAVSSNAALSSARMIAALDGRGFVLATTRNRLESALALPCSAPPACPPQLVCRTQRRTTATGVEVVSRVRDRSDTHGEISLAAITAEAPCA